MYDFIMSSDVYTLGAESFDSGIRRFDPSRPSQLSRRFPRVLQPGNSGRLRTKGNVNRTGTGTVGTERFASCSPGRAA